MYQLTLNEQEVAALAQILDIATKAGGIQVANTTVAMHQKLVAAVQAAQASDIPNTDSELKAES